MIKLFAVLFALTVATSAQATPSAPLQQDNIITHVRQGCGAGMHMINGRCVTTPARRQVRREVIRSGRR